MARRPSHQPPREGGVVYPPAQTGEGPQITIEFLRTVQFENEGRKKGPVFHEARRYTFDANSGFAQRWIKRGAAYDVSQPPPEPAPEPTAPVLTKGGASIGSEDYGRPDRIE